MKMQEVKDLGQIVDSDTFVLVVRRGGYKRN